MMGAERRSMILTEEDKKVTAYHEAGHALVAALQKDADPLHKVSIIPRGRALGITMQLPTGDVLNRTKAQMEARLCVAMAGRLGELRYTHQLSTGARNDIEQATELARAMVCDYGMSDLGPVSFGKKDEQIFLGRDFSQVQDYSERTAQEIDDEVRRIVSEGYERAKTGLQEHIEILHAIADQLLEKEALDGAQIDEIIRLQREQGEPGTPPLTVASDQRA